VMRRREFIAGVGAVVGAAPAAAQAQRSKDRIRRVGILSTLAPDDPAYTSNVGPFFDALKEAGWIEGQNLHFDKRAAANGISYARGATELLELQPDVIFSIGAPSARALRDQTKTVPIVFVLVDDPVGEGLVKSIARPGGNITGISREDFAVGGKWS